MLLTRPNWILFKRSSSVLRVIPTESVYATLVFSGDGGGGLGLGEGVGGCSGLVRLGANARLNTDVSGGYALSGLTVSPGQQLTLAI